MVCIERHATFTGLDDGAIDLTTTVPNTTLVGVWRIDPSGHYELKGLAQDPIVTAAGEQAPFNQSGADPRCCVGDVAVESEPCTRRPPGVGSR